MSGVHDVVVVGLVVAVDRLCKEMLQDDEEEAEVHENDDVAPDYEQHSY